MEAVLDPEIEALIQRAEELREAPHGGRWGAVVQGSMLAAAHNLKTVPESYWKEHPEMYERHVEALRQGVRFMEHIARELRWRGPRGKTRPG